MSATKNKEKENNGNTIWHITVYSSGFGSPYTHPYAVHIFSPIKLTPEEAFEKARELLKSTFPEWNEQEESMRYVGYEMLPIGHHINDIFYVVSKLIYVKDEFKVDFRSTVPKTLASAILSYRMKHVTLDYDRDDDWIRGHVIDAVTELNGKVYKTQRGYHVRAKLPKATPLSEIFKIRGKYLDDSYRMRIDYSYTNAGLGYLTNLLFNEKCWLDESGKMECYTEREIDVRELTTTREKFFEYRLPPTKFTTEKGEIEIVEFETERSNSLIRFRGFFSTKDVEAMMQKIEKMFESDIKKQKLFKAYGQIQPKALYILSRSEIKYENGTIFIYPPKDATKFVGLIIGKNGMNVKAAQNVVGARIIIVAEEKPEEVKMKKKIDELIDSLLLNEQTS
ncbi:MAG: KH domain-containing protein [Pyrobaculum sp.]